MTGRSVKGGGGGGRSNSPSSHSGIDPDLPRGMSSQMDFPMRARGDQIASIHKSFEKLRALRQDPRPFGQINSAKFAVKPSAHVSLQSSQLN